MQTGLEKQQCKQDRLAIMWVQNRACRCAPELLVPVLTEPLLLILAGPLRRHGTTREPLL